MSMKPKIILLDDLEKTSKTNPEESESCLTSFGLRLQDELQCEPLYNSGKDGRGFPLKDVESMAKRLRELIEDEGVDAMVIDLHWWGDQTFGERLWDITKKNGLAMDKKMVVFVTQHMDSADRSKVASRNELDSRQVNYKNTDGYVITLEWLREHL